MIYIPHCKVDNTTLPVVTTAKCLGFWWDRNLLSTKSVEENVKKARRAFFSYGSMGAFQGDLNPLSSKSIIESCVMPYLSLAVKTGSYLKRPMNFSNTSAILALEMETMRSRLVCRKLSFLKRLLGDSATGVGAVAMRSMYVCIINI